jgi:hypothetical protein
MLDWIDLAWDGDEWLLGVVGNCLIPYDTGNLLTG